MSAQTFDLMESIRVTPAAAEHFGRQLAQHGGSAVRVSLEESGCSGYMYSIDEVEAPKEGDMLKTLDNGVIICFAPMHAVALKGSEIDFKREGLNQVLKIDNPNATDACGCGASFNLELSEE